MVALPEAEGLEWAAGFRVDLYVSNDIETMARIWMGEIDVRAALRSGALELDGSATSRHSIHRWLGSSAFAPGARKARRSEPS